MKLNSLRWIQNDFQQKENNEKKTQNRNGNNQNQSVIESKLNMHSEQEASLQT